jgi:Fic family protein
VRAFDAPDWRRHLPQRPEDWLLDDLPLEVQRAVLAADTSKGYLAWDEFRHRPRPGSWPTERLWSLVKLRRSSTARPLPGLVTNAGKPFRLVVSDPLLAALQRIDTRSSLWPVSAPTSGSEDVDRAYRFRVAIEEAFHSSAIEGAVTTRRVAADMIRSGREPRTRSERMVLNNFRTLERLAEWSREPLTPELVCRLHASITDATLADESSVGRLRAADDVVVQEAATGDVVHVPPPHVELPERVQRLCDFANAEDGKESFLHPLLRSIVLHHQLAYDHPFVDGNGRTARALFMWSILRRGYWWFRSLSISRAIDAARGAYYAAFRYVQGDEADVTYFVRQQVRCVEQELERLGAHVARTARLEMLARERAHVEARLNSRQVALLDHALRHDDVEYTFEDHARYHAVTYPTAWHDLTTMEGAGLLERTKRGRRAVFLPTPRLDSLRRA